jgi:hypothetical protein
MLSRITRPRFSEPGRRSVAEAVVDRLEMIQVHDDQGHLRIITLGAPEFPLQTLVESPAVEQPGQGVP